MPARMWVRLIGTVLCLLLARGWDIAAVPGQYTGIDVLFAIENTNQADKYDSAGYRFVAVNQVMLRLADFRRDLAIQDLNDISINVAAMAFTDEPQAAVLLPWQAIDTGEEIYLWPSPETQQGRFPDLIGAFNNPKQGVFAYFDSLYDQDETLEADRRLQIIIVLNAEHPQENTTAAIYDHMNAVVDLFKREFGGANQRIYVRAFNPNNTESDTSFWGGVDLDRGFKMGRYWRDASNGHQELVSPDMLAHSLRELVPGWIDEVLIGDTHQFGVLVDEGAYQMPPYILRARFNFFGPSGTLKLIQPDGTSLTMNAPNVQVTKKSDLQVETWEIKSPLPGLWGIESSTGQVEVDWVRVDDFEWSVPTEAQQYQDVDITFQILSTNDKPIALYNDQLYALNTTLDIVAPDGESISPNTLNPGSYGYNATFTPVQPGPYQIAIAVAFDGEILFKGQEVIDVDATELALEAPDEILQDSSIPVLLRFLDGDRTPISEGIQLKTAYVTLHPNHTCSEQPIGQRVELVKGAATAWQVQYIAPDVDSYEGIATFCIKAEIQMAGGDTHPVTASARTEVKSVSILSLELIQPGEHDTEVTSWRYDYLPPWSSLPVVIEVQVLDASGEPYPISEEFIQAYLSKTDDDRPSLIMATVQNVNSDTVRYVPLIQRANGIWSNVPDPETEQDIEAFDLPVGSYYITVEAPEMPLDTQVKFGLREDRKARRRQVWLRRAINPLIFVEGGIVLGGLALVVGSIVWSVYRRRRISRFPAEGELVIYRPIKDENLYEVRHRIDLGKYKANRIIFELGDFPAANPPLSYLEVRSNKALKKHQQVEIHFALQGESPHRAPKPLGPEEDMPLWLDAADKQYYLAKDPPEDILVDPIPPSSAHDSANQPGE